MTATATTTRRGTAQPKDAILSKSRKSRKKEQPVIAVPTAVETEPTVDLTPIAATFEEVLAMSEAKQAEQIAAPTTEQMRAAGIVDPEYIGMVAPTERNPLGYYKGSEYQPVNPVPLVERPHYAAILPWLDEVMAGDTAEPDTDAEAAAVVERVAQEQAEYVEADAPPAEPVAVEVAPAPKRSRKATAVAPVANALDTLSEAERAAAYDVPHTTAPEPAPTASVAPGAPSESYPLVVGAPALVLKGKRAGETGDVIKYAVYKDGHHEVRLQMPDGSLLWKMIGLVTATGPADPAKLPARATRTVAPAAPRGVTLEQVFRFVETADAATAEAIRDAARRRADALAIVDDLTTPETEGDTGAGGRDSTPADADAHGVTADL